MSAPQNVGTLPKSFRGYVGLALEASYDEGPAPQVFVDATSDGYSYDNQMQYQNTTRSRSTHKAEAGPVSVDGSVDAPANPEGGIGYILAAAMGDETFSQDPNGDGTAPIGEHVFTPADALPSLAVEVYRDTGVVRNGGAGVDSFELSHTAEEKLVWSADLPAATPDPSVTAASPTYSDLRNFQFHDAAFTAGGVDRTPDLQDLTITVGNNVDPLYRDARTAGKMDVGERPVSISATLDFESEELWEYWMGTSGATGVQDVIDTVGVNVTWTSPEVIDGTEQYSLTFDAPSCKVNTHDANINENDLVAENVELRAIVDDTLGHEAEFTLMNGVTQAYAPAP